MSLNFDFSRTAIVAEHGTDELWVSDSGTCQLKGQYDAVLWACLIVGIPVVTEKTVDKLIARVRVYEALEGPFYTRYTDDGQRVSAFDPAVAHKCIGLRTNASTLTRADFLKRFAPAL